MRVKVCGVTTLADARTCIDAGVDAIGLNFVPTSPRRVSWETAQEIADACRSDVLVVGVVADAPKDELDRALHGLKLGCLQFHGLEAPEVVAAYLPHAYKALRARDAGVVDEARRFPGDYVLVDAYDAGALGGTGKTFTWAWAAPLAKERKLTLAGGLTPENVAAAIAAVQPWCVDVASGVESAPGVKDAAKVRAFVAAAKTS